VLSGRGLCDELITRAVESYRLCCVVVCDLETSRMGAPYIYDISHLRVNSFLKLLPYLKFCPLPHVGSVSQNSDYPLFFIVSHVRLKQTSSDFLVWWSQELFHGWCLVVNSSKVWFTFCTFFSLVPNQEALVLLHWKTKEMAHQVTKLAVSLQTPLCQKTLLTSMTRWTKRMRMMMKKQFSRLSHLKWIRSVAVPLFFVWCAHCCLWTLLYVVLHCQFNLSEHVV